MAPHSSTLAWRIPWTEEPGRLQSMGLLRSDTTEWLHFHFSLSCPGEGNGNPLQFSCLENPRDGQAWWAAVYGVAQSQTQLKWLRRRRRRSAGKESASNAGDLGSVAGLGRSPEEGKGYPLQYSGLKNSRGCIPWGCRVDTIEQLITFRSFRAFVDSLTWADTWNSLPYNTSKGLNLSLLLGATDP